MKTSVDFGLESGIVYKGTMGVCERVFIVSIPNEFRKKERKKEKNANSKWH